MINVWIYSSCILQVFIKLNLWLINSSCECIFLFLDLFEESIISATFCVGSWSSLNGRLPPGMALDLLPVYSVDWVLLKHLLNEVIELFWEFWNYWYFLDHYLFNKILQRICIKWWFPSRHLDQYTPKTPKIREIAVHAVVLEKLRGHVVGCPGFVFAAWVGLRVGRSAVFSRTTFDTHIGKISYFFSQSKIAKLQFTILVH